jgi:mRNA-degrading endonuclease RelE of RelBE toxin-antitoxin system
MPIEEAEDLVLANASEYVTMRRQARRDHDRGSSCRSMSSPDRYEVRLGGGAARSFEVLPAEVRHRIRAALLGLAATVSRGDRVGGKKSKTIRGTADEFHRLRVGDHRVMYDVLHDERGVLVLGIVVDRKDLERWLRHR